MFLLINSISGYFKVDYAKLNNISRTLLPIFPQRHLRFFLLIQKIMEDACITATGYLTIQPFHQQWNPSSQFMSFFASQNSLPEKFLLVPLPILKKMSIPVEEYLFLVQHSNTIMPNNTSLPLFFRCFIYTSSSAKETLLKTQKNFCKIQKETRRVMIYLPFIYRIHIFPWENKKEG